MPIRVQGFVGLNSTNVERQMQTLFKFRAVPRSFVRSFSMGKPEEYEPTAIGHTQADEKEKKSVNEPTTKKFTKAHQDYLDSRYTLEDLMKEEEASAKKMPL
jgi:hypothetical protein